MGTMQETYEWALRKGLPRQSREERIKALLMQYEGMKEEQFEELQEEEI